MERKVYFGRQQPWGEGDWGRRVNSCPKADAPPLTINGQELLQAEGRGHTRKSEVSSERHLEIGHAVSDQHHLDCFKYS